MGEILFLAHRIPFPPDRGDKIRSHHLLKALAELAPVHVGCFVENDDDWAEADALGQIAASHKLVHRSKPLWRAGLEGLASGKPVSLTAFDCAALRDWISAILSHYEIDTIFVFSGQMGQYIPPSFSGRVIIDLCDVDSAKFEAYAEGARGPRAWIDRREGVLLAAEEARISARADDVLLISEAEAELFRSRLLAYEEPRISVLGNGIDHAYFDPEPCPGHAELDALAGPKLVFTGQMDYAPNVAAAKRAICQILPQVQRRYPAASLHIVGRAPTAELCAYDGRNGVRIWGEVPDVRPFIKSADIITAPLDIARGVQNKVLEAMAMARPVVLSREAATGIHAQNGAHFIIGEDDAALVEAITALYDAPERRAEMGRAARAFVMAEQSWPAMLQPLARLVGRAGQEPISPAKPGSGVKSSGRTKNAPSAPGGGLARGQAQGKRNAA